jgi:4-diphosphocytidyl-2-C-methyl-D-erythritol kinase
MSYPVLRLRAPAKVNLRLEVRGKRPDGYHELRMLLAPVGLIDELDLRVLRGQGRVEVACGGDPAVEGGAGNLCFRAARFFTAATGWARSVEVRVCKRIPAGAGLGGGSSDAAATLMGLERLSGIPLAADQRREAAFHVGADVPFFFERRAAWVEGIGEEVRPVDLLDPLWLVLVHPGISLATADVFSRFTMGLTSPGRLPTIAQFNFQGIVEGMRNDLQTAAQELGPAVSEALAVLAEAGSAHRLMSGSGSAVFGLFPEEDSARQVASLVGRHAATRPGWRVEVVQTQAPDAFPFLDET